MAPYTSKVVIVGAGAAGIAAAARLLENGWNDVIILEAENRTGGRIHSVEVDGSAVDLGAQWCHGEEGNVVYDLSKDLNLLGPAINNYADFTFYSSNGTAIDKAITDRLLALASELSEDEESAKSCKGTFGEYFIKEYRVKVNELQDENIKNTSELLLEWFHKLWMDLEGANSWFEVSATAPFKYKKCKGNLYLHWKNKGYKTILDILMKKIPHSSTKHLSVEDKIHFSKEVNKIIWDSNIYNNGGVTVFCSDGSSYNCQQVIITVSLGVLKTISNCFVPSLPPVKQKAIETMTIGDVHKIFLKFSSKWWPDDETGFSFVWNQEDRKKIREEFPHGPSDDGKSWLEDVFGFYVVDSHPDVLLGWAVGKMVKDVEKLPDDIVIDGCVHLLRKFLGKMYKISRPNGVFRSFWRNNPHFNGCYSYFSLEAERRSASFEDLACPVVNGSDKPVLLFAGEATHSHFYSTVHGAIETGFREADRVLNYNLSSKLIHRKVAIVGAGMAGLGAALTLQKLGCSDFVLIEAQSRCGGRINTATFRNNILELGAQWIHGKENPLYELAREYDLLSEVTSEEGLGPYIRDNGEIIHEEIVKTVAFEVGKILCDCEQFVEAVDYPKSVGEYVEARFMQYLNTCQDSDDIKDIKLELFDWHVRFQIIDNSCLSLNELSAKSWGRYVCVDDRAHINLKCGFSEFVKILVNELPRNSILLSSPVAAVHRAHGTSKTNKIICSNGVVVRSDFLIMTPSLGALKRMDITPPLPNEISMSIQDLGFHPIGKIFLIFEYKWWNSEGFQFVWRKDAVLADDISWVRHITGFDPVVHAPTALLGWVGGEGVKVMESLSEEDVGNDCMTLLRRFIRNQTVPNPVKVIRTAWLSNPWVLGAYSHVTPDCDRSGLGMHKLSEPILVDGKPRILIAGEAANPSHFSTIHGAYESGQEQARLLAEHLIEPSKL